MKNQVNNMLNRKLFQAQNQYMEQVEKLAKEYRENNCGSGSPKKMQEAVEKVIQLSSAFQALRTGYEEARAAFDNTIERTVDKYDEYFLAKLNGKPHEWD